MFAYPARLVIAATICVGGAFPGGAVHHRSLLEEHHYVANHGNLKCSSTRGKKLVYYGGSITGDAIVRIIYWGSWWLRNGKSAKSEIKRLYSGLGSSEWAKTLAQYCEPGSPPFWPANLVKDGGVFFDKANPPKRPTDAEIGHEAAKYTSTVLLGIPVLPIEVIATPPGSIPVFDSKHHYCSHHSWSSFTKKSQPYNQPWIDIPYGLISRDGCGWKLKQGAAGALSVVAGHEWAEVVTDPFVNGTDVANGIATAWATSGHVKIEVGDICESSMLLHFIHKNTFIMKLKTGAFVMQKLWSNAAGRCVE